MLILTNPPLHPHACSPSQLLSMPHVLRRLHPQPQASAPTSVLLPGAQAHAHTLSSCAFSCFCSSDSLILPAHRPPAGQGTGSASGMGDGRQRRRQAAAELTAEAAASVAVCSVAPTVTIGDDSHLQRALGSQHRRRRELVLAARACSAGSAVHDTVAVLQVCDQGPARTMATSDALHEKGSREGRLHRLPAAIEHMQTDHSLSSVSEERSVPSAPRPPFARPGLPFQAPAAQF